MAKVSVLVPVYNVKKYLKECLDSLCLQTMKDIEIICVDDGSTDGSSDVLDTYTKKDRRFKVIHKKNTGYGNTMNVALDVAEGDYVAILESDDFAVPEMIERLWDTACFTGADIVKGEYYRYRGGKDEFSNRLSKYPRETVFSVIERPDVLELADTIWSCLYKREFLENNHIRFHETPGASFQDISFALQGWLYAKKVCFIPDALLHYRTDNASSSMHNPDKIFCVFDEYGWVEERFWEEGRETPALLHGFVATKYRDYFNHYHRVAVPYKYALLLRIAESFLQDEKSDRISEEAFLPSVWQELMRVNQNLNNYFKETLQNLEDPRLEFCDFENKNVYKKALVEELQSYDKVFLYGAGSIGKQVFEKMCALGIRVDGFVVTKADEKKEYLSLPLYSLEDVRCYADNSALLISAAQRLHYEMYISAQEYGFKHIFCADAIVKEL